MLTSQDIAQFQNEARRLKSEAHRDVYEHLKQGSSR